MKRIVIFSLVVMALASCNESFIEDYRENPNELSGEVFWQDPNNAQNVLASAYVQLTDNPAYGRQFHEPFCLMTHEADLDYLNFDYWNQFNTNSVTSRNQQVEYTWRFLYRVIRDVNDVIEHQDMLEPTGSFTQEEIDDMLGQAFFIRAFAYHHLVALFGEAYPAENPEALAVPLLLETAKNEGDFYAPRATVSQVYEQMEADYKMAIDLLPKDNPRKDLSVDAGRISIYAAHGYLGKAYLFQEKYEEAIDQFEIIIESGHFELLETMRHVYDGNHEFNSESILEWNYSNLSEGLAQAYEGGTFQQFTLIHGPSVQPGLYNNFYVSDYSIERFGDDPRKFESIVMIGDRVAATATGLKLPARNHPTTRKFNNPEIVESVLPGFTTNIIPMRLSDIYLLYAEALNAVGQDGTASEYVNKVRRRAYFEPIDSPSDIDYNLTGTALRDTIREERWRELHYEMHRWYDIQRWGIVEEELSKVSNTASGPVVVDEYDKYWPIPEREMMLNPNFKQNKGY